MEFPFEDAPNTAAISCCHIIEERKPILYASHDADDGMWQFLCGGKHNESEARIVSLAEIYEVDKSISELAQMPCGCCAERENMNCFWKIEFKRRI